MLATALDLAGDILDFDANSVESGDNKEEHYGNSKHKKAIAATTVQTTKSSSRNEYEDYEDKEGEGSPGEK